MIQTKPSIPLSSETLLIEKPRHVDVAAIETELAHLWKPIPNAGAGEGNPVVRACSANLVVVADDISIIHQLEPVLDDITADHPARIFLVLTERNATSPRLDAWISARCSLPVPGSSQVCCEQINLAAQGTDIDKIPSVITSLLVPDVPAILLWKSRIDQHEAVLPLLVEIADRVLVDTSVDRNPLTSVAFWLSSINRHSRRTSFGDLAWSDGEEWRFALAEIFDPPDMRNSLREIDRIEISYSVSRMPYKSGLGASMLLAGWLASRLQWTPLRELAMQSGLYTATVRSGEHAISIALKERQETENPAGSITGVRIHCANGLEMSAEEDVLHRCIAMTVHSASGEVSRHFIPADLSSAAVVLGKELDDLYHDKLYELALAALVNTVLGRTR